MQHQPTRRSFLRAGSSLALTSTGLGFGAGGRLLAQEAGQRPEQSNRVEVLNPRHRVPLSFIIDDSTALVNLAHFGIPQFRQTFPDRYKQDWRSLPREIPDDFVREFADWCADRGVKGKYSVVPYPACVGWVDRFMPGWSKRQLRDSLRLVRDRLLDHWDIHPEMVSHTRVVDITTGRPYANASPDYMENWGWSQDKSADELAAYMAYALRILRNVDLPCEGITTPGGFGSQNRANLARATLESCREVFNAEIPHYFRDLFTDDRSVAPRVYYASGLDSDDPRCVVSVVGCTGDWFGGWDGLSAGSVDRFITEDLQSGRMVEVIERGEPAVMVCHWPGIYFNGERIGFDIFKQAVDRIHRRYDRVLWMRPSEIARYWAAKELTAIDHEAGRIRLRAPYAAPDFTLRLPAGDAGDNPPQLETTDQPVALKRVRSATDLRSGTYLHDGQGLIACFDLPAGRSTLRLS